MPNSTCYCCKQSLPAASFGKNAQFTMGHSSQEREEICLSCVKEIAACKAPVLAALQRDDEAVCRALVLMWNSRYCWPLSSTSGFLNSLAEQVITWNSYPPERRFRPVPLTSRQIEVGRRLIVKQARQVACCELRRRKESGGVTPDWAALRAEVEMRKKERGEKPYGAYRPEPPRPQAACKQATAEGFGFTVEGGV